MYTYGPVPSRRLGRSLGVSTIPPKTCSYTCIYCQLGRTNLLQTEREHFFDKDVVLAEILQRAGQTDVEFVTFVGDGEPTLSADLGWLIRRTREETNLPTAVITNGSLLWREDVREELSHADVVMPTLDAGSEKTFRRMNRPHRAIHYAAMLQGLVDFRKQYSGQIWLEVMLVEGVNDTPQELEEIRQAVAQVNPDRVYIVTPIRPPAESWVKPPSPETVLQAQKILGQSIAIAGTESGTFGLHESADAEAAIMETGSRHPLRQNQAREIARHFGESDTVDHLLASGKLIRVEYQGEVYLLPAHFKRST